MRPDAQEMMVVVFDGGGARFFAREANGRLILLNEIDSGLHKRTQDVVSDKEGRGFASSHSGVRHAYEPKHDKHKQEKRNFVQRIVDIMDDAYDKDQARQFAVVGPERSLGEFRALASTKLLRSIWLEVPKDFTQYAAHELQTRLQPYFESESAGRRR